MQTDIKQGVATYLKDARFGLQKYLGAETDNALNELVNLLIPDLQTAANEATAKAVRDQLAQVDISPEALVRRLMEARANRPDPVPRKRMRKPKNKVVIDGIEAVRSNDLTD